VIIVANSPVLQELFSGIRDYISRPTHDRLVALRQTSRIPREGKQGGGTTWPASLLFFQAFVWFPAIGQINELGPKV
jgi:hypothetical protein